MRLVQRVCALLIAVLAIAGFAANASATNITWLDTSPVPLGTPIPNSSNYLVPGIGIVNVSFVMSGVMTEARGQSAYLQSGSLGPYSWTNHEYMSTIFTVGPDPLVPELWTVTYTFPPQPAGTVYFGADGLGQTQSYGGGATTVTVNQNGTFLGDWTGGGGPWGPTQFTGGAGTFSMQNSLTGSGGLDPWWNTPLGVVKIGDPVSSITVYGSQIRGDGIGINIGFETSDATPTSSTTWGRVKRLYH